MEVGEIPLDGEKLSAAEIKGLLAHSDGLALIRGKWIEVDHARHVAAALYGVGARLDEKPQLLFVLRGVDENELLDVAGQDVALSKTAPAAAKVLDDSDVAALFGLEMAETPHLDTAIPAVQKRSQRFKALTGSKTPVGKTNPVGRNHNSHRATQAKSGPKQTVRVGAKKRRIQRRLQHSS